MHAQFDKFFWEKRQISDSLSQKVQNGLAIFNKISSDSFELRLYANYDVVDPYVFPLPGNEPVELYMDSLFQIKKPVILILQGKISKDISGNRFFIGKLFDNQAYEKSIDKGFILSEEGLFGFSEYKRPDKSKFEEALQTQLTLTKYKFKLHESLENQSIKQSTIVKDSSFGKMVFRHKNSVFTIYLPN